MALDDSKLSPRPLMYRSIFLHSSAHSEFWENKYFVKEKLKHVLNESYCNISYIL